MVNNINPNSVCPRENFYAKAAKFKELTGREIVNEKDENGDFIHMLHPQSTQRLNFMADFLRVGFTSPDGSEAALKNLAAKYAQLKDELSETYGDNENELYQRLGELNHAFENALQNMVLLPLQTPPDKNIISSNMPQNTRDNIEREWQRYDDMHAFTQTVKLSMAKYLDAFFEIFIKNIQTMDFESAFSSTLEALNADEPAPLHDI
jgi:hypothetical protein